MLWISLCFLSLLLSPEIGASPQNAPPLPPDIRRAVDHVLELAAAPYHVDPRERNWRQKLAQARQSMGVELEQLANQIPRDLALRCLANEGRDIRTKVIALTWDRKMRPDIYAQIEQGYLLKVVDPMARAPHAPDLDLKHATEDYRRAWEFYLLFPAQGAAPRFEVPATDALELLHNDASVVTLLQLYRMTAAERVESEADSSIERRQQLLLWSLSRFASEVALRAILECLDLSANQQKRLLAGKRGWDVRSIVLKFLISAEDQKVATGWRKTMDAFPKQGLTPEQRALLRSVSASSNPQK